MAHSGKNLAKDLEEAYALGELYAVHTLRPNENQPSQ